MFNFIQARAQARAAAGATALGAVITLTFGGAYLAGGMANAAVERADISRLANAADGSWSDDALRGAMDWDHGALAVARRHDPYSVAGPAERDRQATLLSERLQLRARQDADTDNAMGGLQFRPAQLNVLNSSREHDCLAKGIYFEARGEGTAGMQAVAQVIVNRARHPAFPSSICAVIYQGAGKGRGCQFSFACDGSMRRGVSGPMWDRARQIASQALDGQVSSPVGTATFFHATRVSPNWRGLQRVATIGRHVFYRYGGARGAPSAFTRDTLGGGDFARPTLYAVASKAGEDQAEVVSASYTTKGPSAAKAKPAADAADAADAATPSLDAVVDAATKS